MCVVYCGVCGCLGWFVDVGGLLAGCVGILWLVMFGLICLLMVLICCVACVLVVVLHLGCDGDRMSLVGGFGVVCNGVFLPACWRLAAGVMITHCVGGGLICCLGDYTCCFSLLICCGVWALYWFGRGWRCIGLGVLVRI